MSQPSHGPYNPPSQQGWTGPNPYAQQAPQYGGQAPPPPGFPPQAPQSPPPGPPGRRARRGLIALVVGIVVALAGVGGGAWLYLGGDSGGSHQAKPKPRPEHPHKLHSGIDWKAPAPKGKIVDYVASDGRGTWFTDRAVIKQEIKTVKAYDRKSGDVLWTVPLPGDICGDRTPPAGGTLALTFKAKGVCNQLTLIDLADHRRLWTTPLAAEYEDGKAVQYVSSARSGDALIIAGERSLERRRLSDGGKEWSVPVRDGWYQGSVVGGDRLLSTTYKVRGKQTLAREVQEIDPRDGSATWTWPVPKGQRVASFVSTSPVVIGLAERDAFQVDQFIALDAKGDQRSRISIAKKGVRDKEGRLELAYEPWCDMVGCDAAVVADDTLYLPTEDMTSEDSEWEYNKLVAFRLDNGRLKWSKDAGAKRTALPVGIDGDNVIAYSTPTGESGGKLVRFNLASGKKSLYQQHPDSESEDERDAYGIGTPNELYLDRGQFFIVTETLTGSEKIFIHAYE
ncbi:PQQ-binding-like beta-propeller repeat protein [Streptomyces sp. NPDC002055]|uniref:outer membrane protein assembly factor BamB family protein n=1 Tax=Streptomyces sp. NPDC002055 TaxID=3154534 RepID=UPI0033226EE3